MASLLYFRHPDFLLFPWNFLKNFLSYKPCVDNYEHNRKNFGQIGKCVLK